MKSTRRISTLVGMAAILALAGPLPASAHQTTGRHHKTENGAGCAVSHGHYGQCVSGKCVNGATCPTNAICESSFGFNSAHRKYSWTNAWNCHGRTFDNRGSWTGTADLFISCANGVCPVSPQVGDVVMWSNGTVHSVTIKGAWNGLSTLVRSKYGCCGEYEHALSNSTNTYGSNWVVIRLFNSPVFLTGGNGGEGSLGEGVPVDLSNLEETAKSMPWHSSVLASAVEYAVEHPQRVWASGQVGAESLARLRATEDPQQRLEILAADLRDPRHYDVLAAYERPVDSMDFIEGVEAGRALVKLAREYPSELREAVVRLLEETALDDQHSDGARAAAILFASRILGPRERADLGQRVGNSLRSEVAAEAEGLVNLVDYYNREFLQSGSDTK